MLAHGADTHPHPLRRSVVGMPRRRPLERLPLPWRQRGKMGSAETASDKAEDSLVEGVCKQFGRLLPGGMEFFELPLAAVERQTQDAESSEGVAHGKRKAVANTGFVGLPKDLSLPLRKPIEVPGARPHVDGFAAAQTVFERAVLQIVPPLRVALHPIGIVGGVDHGRVPVRTRFVKGGNGGVQQLEELQPVGKRLQVAEKLFERIVLLQPFAFRMEPISVETFHIDSRLCRRSTCPFGDTRQIDGCLRPMDYKFASMQWKVFPYRNGRVVSTTC